jgi:hypothetical protein
MTVVTVRNVGKVPVAFDLYHVLYCEISRDCRCDVQRVLRPAATKTGEVKTHYDRVVSPRAIYLAPGQTSLELHPAVGRIPFVKMAIRTGVLEVKTIEAPLQPVAPTQENADKRRSNRGSKHGTTDTE